MTITRTVEIPESHRLVIDVPREVPAGPVILAFVPAETEAQKASGFGSAKRKYKTPEEIDAAINRIQELCKDSPISVDSFLEMRRQERDLEEKRYQNILSTPAGSN